MAKIVTDYVSEHTRFINEWLEKHPEAREEQRKGRALWWDKPQDEALNRGFARARVPQKPYYYDVN